MPSRSEKKTTGDERSHGEPPVAIKLSGEPLRPDKGAAGICRAIYHNPPPMFPAWELPIIAEVPLPREARPSPNRSRQHFPSI